MTDEETRKLVLRLAVWVMNYVQLTPTEFTVVAKIYDTAFRQGDRHDT